MDVPPCQLRRRSFHFVTTSALSASTFRKFQAPHYPLVMSTVCYRKWPSRNSEFCHDTMVIFHSYVSFTKREPILAKWNMLHPSPSQPHQHGKNSQPGLLGALPAKSELEVQLRLSSCTSNSLLAAWLELLVLPRSAYFS